VKKYSIIGFAIVLLIAVALLSLHHYKRPNDAELRQRVVGSWIGPSDNLELTMSSDGSYVSKFMREGMDYAYEGTWKIKDGFLITTLTANKSTNTKHTMHVGSVESFRIVHVDDQELIDEVGSGGMVVYTNYFEKLTK
jgi:hypothetical protein